MKEPKHPCDQKCPDRNAECHAHCEKWLAFEKEKFAYYEWKKVKAIPERIANGIEKDRAVNMVKRKRRKKNW